MELKTLFQRIAAAIREKDGTTAPMKASAFPERISAISSGTDTSDATAAAEDILSGKTAYAGGEKVTGTMAVQGAQTITPGPADQTIAAGQYLAGAQTIQGDEKLVADNIKSGVSVFGVEGSCIDWKDYKAVRGYAYTMLNNQVASFYLTNTRILEKEDGTKSIECDVTLMLDTTAGKSTKATNIYVDYA